MDTALCKLTLVYPPAIEDAVSELLLTADPPLYGFTTWTADGHGLDFATATTREKVRGRIRRGVMVLVLSRQRLPALLDRLKSNVKVPGMAYWVEPVERFERLTIAAAATATAAPADQDGDAASDETATAQA